MARSTTKQDISIIYSEWAFFTITMVYLQLSIDIPVFIVSVASDNYELQILGLSWRLSRSFSLTEICVFLNQTWANSPTRMESLPAKTHILRVDRLDGDLTNKNGGLVRIIKQHLMVI